MKHIFICIPETNYVLLARLYLPYTDQPVSEILSSFVRLYCLSSPSSCRNVDTIAYTTVGTGIGVGVVVKGQELTGLLHPEGGHFYPRRHRLDTYAGNCPYHADCLEGLANAQACAERCSVPPHCLADVNDDHATWDLAAYYLAQLCVNATLLLSPQVIVLGGGVLKRKVLFPKIRAKTLELLNGYVQADKIINHIDKYIVPSKFNAEGSKTTSGAVGALHLAQRAFIEASKE